MVFGDTYTVLKMEVHEIHDTRLLRYTSIHLVLAKIDLEEYLKIKPLETTDKSNIRPTKD